LIRLDTVRRYLQILFCFSHFACQLARSWSKQYSTNRSVWSWIHWV